MMTLTMPQLHLSATALLLLTLALLAMLPLLLPLPFAATLLQYLVMKYVGTGGSHIHDWWSACKPAILSTDAERNRSWHVSMLIKILDGPRADCHSK
jgi:hypothetical protein